MGHSVRPAIGRLPLSLGDLWMQFTEDGFSADVKRLRR